MIPSDGNPSISEAGRDSCTAQLVREVFDDAQVGSLNYLTWLYRDNPLGSVIEKNLDFRGERLGHYAVVPLRVLGVEEQLLEAALSVNTAVAAEARRRGEFVKLAKSAYADAEGLGVKVILGVANANSSPGFVRRLDFQLVSPLSATLHVPSPLRVSRDESIALTPDAMADEALWARLQQIVEGSRVGGSVYWDRSSLNWRLSRPGQRYAIHFVHGAAAVSTVTLSKLNVKVAVILKVFAEGSLSTRQARRVVSAVTSHHRAPVALHSGLPGRWPLTGVSIPPALRPSPLNLICKPLGATDFSRASMQQFEFLDFDAF